MGSYDWRGGGVSPQTTQRREKTTQRLSCGRKQEGGRKIRKKERPLRAEET